MRVSSESLALCSRFTRELGIGQRAVHPIQMPSHPDPMHVGNEYAPQLGLPELMLSLKSK